MDKNRLRQIIREELTISDKDEIKKIFRAEYDKKLSSTDLKNAVEEIVRKQLKGDNKTKKEVAAITQKVLLKLYKVLWTKHSFWSNNLENI